MVRRLVGRLCGWPVWIAWAAGLAAACSSPSPPPVSAGPAASSLRELLEREHAARVRTLPQDERAVAELAAHDVVVILVTEPRVPLLPPAAAAALHAQVQRGQKLLLLGYAPRLAHELGIEPQPPDRYEPYRWGWDDRTALGTYEFGFRGAGATLHGLDEELRPIASGQDAYLLGGGELVSVPSCHWEQTPPQRGVVLGKLARTLDGTAAALDAAVLVHWRDGAGAVLGYGHVPEPGRADATIAHNARQFVRNAITVLAGKPGRVSVGLCVESEAPVRAPAPALAPLRARELPLVHSLPHWGLELPLVWQQDARTPLPPAVVNDAILAAWRAGASLVLLRPADPDKGYPLAWLGDDPLRRPATFRGDSFWPSWPARQLQATLASAGARGLQSWLEVSPLPVRGGGTAEQLAALKWLCRELGDGRRLGPGACSAVLLDTPADPQGLGAGLVSSYQPGGTLLTTRGAAAHALVALEPELGRPHGLNAPGLSEVWRLPPDGLADAALLDLRTRRPSPRLWGAEARDACGGGGYGDWVVTQLHDFARGKLGTAGPEGAAGVWRAFNPALVPEESLRYAFGVGQYALHAAVAGRLWATGKGGWRDLQAAFLERVQSGFGAESPLPANTPFLQNNHFRLHGSGGPLWFDATGRARFRERDPGLRVLAQNFMVTQVRGARPRSEMLQDAQIDFIGGHPRATGNYAAVVAVQGIERGAARFPAILALDDVPNWPRKVEVTFRAAAGEMELDLALRGVQGRGVVEVRAGGELQHLVPFRSERQGERLALAFPIAAGGEQKLSLEVVDGGAVAIDVCRLLRRGDLAAATRIVEPAGARAELAEQTGSTFFNERATWTTHADLPGCLWHVDYGEMDRQLTVVREFGLTGFAGVAATHEPHDHLRGPFVLTPGGGNDVGALAVIPVELPTDHWFEWNGTRLTLQGHPRAHEQLTVGFLFLRDHDASDLASLLRAFAEMHRPAALELGKDGSVIAGALPIPWPRVVKIHNPARTPYRVKEHGYWLHRGAQPAAGGGDWVLVHCGANEALEVLGGDAFERRTRPGPGSLHAVALKEPQALAVTVRVLSVGPLLAAPSVTLESTFDEVLLDGRPWSYWHERTVCLPRVPGTYRVLARISARSPGPRLVRTDADVRECRFDANGGALEVHSVPRADQGPDAQHVAWFAGSEPAAIEGGSRIPEEELTYPRAEEEAARAAGFLVRFRPGLLRIRFMR